MKVNESTFDDIISRSKGKDVRSEDMSEFQKYLKKVEWMDMGSSKYLYAKFDYPYSEYHNGGCSLNEIIEIQKELPKDVHIMTRSNLNWLKKNGIQFREINTAIRWGCSIAITGHEKVYFSSTTYQSRYNWCDYVVAYVLDHPLDDYCVSVGIELYGRNRSETNRFLTTPKNVLTVNIKNRTDNIFTEKCCGFKLVKDKKSVNESVFDDIISRSKRGNVRKEDELDFDTRGCLDDYIEGFIEMCSDGYQMYEPSLNYFIDYLNNGKGEGDDEYIDILLKYVPNNWDKGENIQSRIKKGTMNESVFDDVISRSKGAGVRKEDDLSPVNRKILDKYMKLFIDKDSFDGYKAGGDDKLHYFSQYILKYRDLFKYMEKYEGYDVPKILAYVERNWDKGMNIKKKLDDMYNSVNESVFDDVISRSKTSDVRKEDELSPNEIKNLKMFSTTFADYVFFYEAYQNIQVDFERYCRDLYRKFVPCNVDDVISHVKRNWNKGVDYESFINDHIKKNEEMLKKHGFKKLPDETIKDTLDDFWNGLGYGDKYEILDDSGYEVIRQGWDDDDGTYDEYWDNMHWEEKIEIYVDYNKDVNESVFDDVIRRSKGDDLRQEDELDKGQINYIKNNLLYTYTYRLAYNDKNDVINPDMNACCDSIRGFYKNSDLKNIITHIKGNWNKGENYHDLIRDGADVWRQQVFDLGFKKKSGESISDTLINWWNSIDDKYSKVDILLNNDVDVREDDDPDEIWDNNLSWKKLIEIYLNENSMNESVFDDVIARSKGDDVRKEDELGENNHHALRWYISLFAEEIANNSSYENTLEDFIDFIKDFKDHPKIDMCDPDIDKIIGYVEDNFGEGECLVDTIDATIDEIDNGMNECDVIAPNGGLVLGDVQGMGPITLPGECGEKGSGDLPMPTGKVYQQVAPFGTFIKTKKKKKKKFRKEDEPCAHSDNPPIYDYVDDFRDYVDRTYNKIK